MDQFFLPLPVDLFPQAAEVDIHVVGAASVVIVPNLVLNLLPGEDLFLVPDQILQNGKLLGQQGNLLSAPDSLPPLGVQGQVPHGKPVGALAHPLAGHGPDTGQQLGKVKGFDQKIKRLLFHEVYRKEEQ